MRAKLALAVAAVVALGTLWFWAGRGAGRLDRAPTLSAFDDRLVSALTLSAPAASCRLVRQDGGWRIVAPVEDAASASGVEEILVALRRTPIVQSVPSAEPLSAFGLDPPAMRVALEGVSVPAVDIGDLVPTGDGVYARIDGRPGVVVLRLPDAAPLATAGLAQVRDAALVAVQPSAITAIDIAPGDVRLRKAGVEWWLDAPARLPASSARVEDLLASLAKGTIAAWDDDADPADAPFGLASGEGVTLTAGERKRTIALGSPAGPGMRYALRDGRGPVLTVALPGLDLRAQGVDTLRETKLTNVNRYDVTRVAYARGADRFAAVRGGDGTWSLEGGGSVATERVLELLVGVLEVPTSSWSAGTLPSGAASAAAEYTTAGGMTGRIEVHGDRAAWSGAPGTVFRLAAALPSIQ